MPSLVVDVYVPKKYHLTPPPCRRVITQCNSTYCGQTTISKPAAGNVVFDQRKNSSDRDVKHQWAILPDEFEAKSKELLEPRMV
jgi:hypothetical protein